MSKIPDGPTLTPDQVKKLRDFGQTKEARKRREEFEAQPPPETPEPYAPEGTRVEVTGGVLPNPEGTQEACGAATLRGRVDGAPYVAQGGSYKGRVMQPIRAQGGALVAVPTSHLKRVESSKSRRNFGMPRVSQQQWDGIFGKKGARK